MNKAILLGRLTNKPELRYTTTNVAYTRVTVAVDGHTNKEGIKETNFIPVTIWRKQAENVCNYLDKGSQVLVEGKIQTGSYDDKEGNKRYTTDVQVDNVRFLGKINKEKVEYATGTAQPTFETLNDPFEEFGSAIEEDNLLD